MKLHIGGKEIKEGWSILNIQKNDGVDFIGDISDYQLSMPLVDKNYKTFCGT